MRLFFSALFALALAACGGDKPPAKLNIGDIGDRTMLTMIEEVCVAPFITTAPFLRIYYSDDNLMRAIKALQKRNFGLQVQIVQMSEYASYNMTENPL